MREIGSNSETEMKEFAGKTQRLYIWLHVTRLFFATTKIGDS